MLLTQELKKRIKIQVWCMTQFELQKTGSKDVVYCQRTGTPLVTKEDMFDAIKKCHEAVGHIACGKTWEEIKSTNLVSGTSWFTFSYRCVVCTKRLPARHPPAGKSPLKCLVCCWHKLTWVSHCMFGVSLWKLMLLLFPWEIPGFPWIPFFL